MECVSAEFKPNIPSLGALENRIRNKLYSFYEQKAFEIFELENASERTKEVAYETYEHSMQLIGQLRVSLDKMENEIKERHEIVIDQCQFICSKMEESLTETIEAINKNLTAVRATEVSLGQLIGQLEPVNTNGLIEIQLMQSQIKIDSVQSEAQKIREAISKVFSNPLKEMEMPSVMNFKKQPAPRKPVKEAEIVGQAHSEVLQTVNNQHNLFKKLQKNFIKTVASLKENFKPGVKGQDKKYSEMTFRPKREPSRSPLRKPPPTPNGVLNKTRAMTPSKSDFKKPKSKSIMTVGANILTDPSFIRKHQRKTTIPHLQSEVSSLHENNEVENSFELEYLCDQKIAVKESQASLFVSEDQMMAEPINFETKSKQNSTVKISFSSELFSRSQNQLLQLSSADLNLKDSGDYDYVFLGEEDCNRFIKYEIFDKDLKYKAVKFLNTNKHQVFIKKSAKIYDPASKKLFILGGKEIDQNNRGHFSSKVHEIDFQAQTISESKSMALPTTLAGSAVCISNGVFYLTGGRNYDQIFDLALAMDPSIGKTRVLASMIVPRDEHAMCVLGNEIYCIGGFGSKEFTNLSSVERYNIQTGVWTSINSMNIARRSHNAIAFKEKIYVFGGYDGHKYLESVELFDPSKNQWSILPPMKIGRCSFGLSVNSTNDGFIIAGGFNGSKLNLIEEYSADEDISKKKQLASSPKLLLDGKYFVVCCRVQHEVN